MSNPQDLLREFVALDRERRATGVTPLEYQRWMDLRQQLGRKFPDRPPLGRRGIIRIRAEFPSRAALKDAVMLNLRPIGIFVGTPFAPEKGTSFELRVFVLETGERFDSDVEVVSNNVGPDFSTQNLGMGLRFVRSSCDLRNVLNELCGYAEEKPKAKARTA